MVDTFDDDASRGDLSSIDQSASESPSEVGEDVTGGEVSEEDDLNDGSEKKTKSSRLKAEDLKGDLEDALSMNFDFKGDFAFACKLSDAPNPGLQIAPLGLIGLPLSERDAQSIKDIASQAPFGHGDQLVVDTSVRHTWEIEPANTITFANPTWSSFINLVAKRACTELGVPLGSKAPKCELYKLLLYEPGSHFLPHQDTEKVPGMFATIVVILPSFYTGGQVQVSHGVEKKMFDFSSDGFATSMLTWYADVVHEVQTITSGYRLALSYNLIQEEASAPLPTVPSTSPTHIRLEGVLQKWSQGLYDNPPPQIAYVLDHKYSRVDLGSGGKSLKGKDAQLVTALRQLASKHRVALALAELECHVVGGASDDFDAYGSYHKRRRCYYDEYSDDYDDDVPTMGEEESRTIKISSLVDLDGNQLIGKESISLDNEELIPEDPFEDDDPDERDYEGYMGNYPGDVQYWYRRAVVVLYLEANSHELLLRAGGAAYAMLQLRLREIDRPSSLDRQFANYVVEHFSSSNAYHGKEQEWLSYMFALALRWKDSEMWLKIASRIGPQQNFNLIGEERLNAAWEAFGFDTLRPFFQNAVAQCPNLTAQMTMLDSVLRIARSEDDRTRVSMWCDEQKMLALTHMKTPVEQDVLTLINVLKSKGVQFFADTIQPQFSRHRPSFKFLLVFIEALREEKEQLAKHPAADLTYKQAVEFCLMLAIGQWKVAEVSQYPYAHYGQPINKQQPSSSFSRIKEIVEMCLLTEQMEACKMLLESLIKDKGDIGMKFKNYFIPLVPELRRLLNSSNVPLNCYPFGDFFRYVIETFLTDMLGAKTGKMRTSSVRKVGCGCMYCQDLDTFLLSVQDKKVFRYGQEHRRHMEQRLYHARDLATFRTIPNGRPHGLEVIKHAEVVAMQTWEGRQKVARNFLASFGGDGDLKLIMGPRFTDVSLAISGGKPYSNIARPYKSTALTTTTGHSDQTAQAASSNSAEPARELHSPLSAGTEQPASANITAGTKRTYLGFIDLSNSP
ncbi:hypothetical protein ACEPAG_4587 [Sanghuangporus baumii]